MTFDPGSRPRRTPGADPALALGAFAATVTDVAGFFAFLGPAAAVLP